MAVEGLEGGLHLAQPRRHPDGALLNDPDPQIREGLEHAIEDHGGERLRRRDGDAHVVDGPEILFAAVEVEWDGLAVDEVVGVDEGARAPDVEDDRDAAAVATGLVQVGDEEYIARL